MNWLAHLYLSDPSPAERVGNLLPDLLPMASWAPLPSGFQRGIRMHLCIDAFTDAHPIVRQSIERFHPPLRRFGGILTDLFYDHFLAQHWGEYSPDTLGDFTDSAYRAFGVVADLVPEEARLRLDYIHRADLLNSYRSLQGLCAVVERVGRRFRKPVDLREGVTVLEQQYEHFRADFQKFFPLLCAHLSEAEQWSPPVKARK